MGVYSSLGWVPLLGSMVYSIGIYGLMTNRKNLILLLMSAEISILGILLCLGALSAAQARSLGCAYALVVLAVAAAESAVGLSLALLWYRTSGDIRLLRRSRLRS